MALPEYFKLRAELDKVRNKKPNKKGCMSFKGTAKEFKEYLEELKGVYTNEN